jgi:hypothetical protein
MLDQFDPKSRFNFWYDGDGKLVLVCRQGELMYLTCYAKQSDWRANATRKN